MRRALLGCLAAQLAGCSLLIDVDGVRRTRDAGGAPVVVGDRTALDFGSGPVGAASPQAVLRLSNTGTAPAGSFTVVVTGAEVFGIPDVSGCQDLAAGASCEVSITFTPTAAQAFSSTLTITASPGGSVSLLISGTGVAPGALSIDPQLVDFGSVVQAGNSATLTFTVHNTGAGPTGTLATRITGVDEVQFEITADGCDAQVLAADAACTVSTRFAPGTPGPRRATLTVTGAPGGTAVATLLGVGLAPGALGISPSSRTLAPLPVGSQGTPVTFQVTNSGSAATGPLTLALTGGAAADFELVSTDCGPALAPTTSCSAQVRFTPRSPGSKVATLTAAASPGGQASASLSAVSQAAAALTAAPALFNFGTVITTRPATTTITVSNPGAVATGVPTVTLSGGQATQFSLGANGCTAALAPGGSCAVVVQFAPLMDGVMATSLVVSATPGGAVTVPLSGTAVLPSALEITPPTHAFGYVVQGSMSAPRTFTITNTGGAPSSALSAALTGTNADQFSLVDGCTGLVLAPLASCDVTVRFGPTAGGSKSAALEVFATEGGTAVATLNGAGRLLAALGISPAAADVGSQVGGQPGMSATFEVVNNGDVATTTPLVATLGGAQAASYSITANTCTGAPLAGGARCGVTVQFLPAVGVIGPQAAVLNVQPVSGPGGLVTATLSGTALTPSALVFDNPSFGAVLIGTPVVRALTLTNTGGATSGPISLSIGGSAAAEFSILTPTGSDCLSDATTLIGGASCTVQVRWVSTARGARSASLAATATPGGTATGTLTGTGLQQGTLVSSINTLALGPTENGLASSAGTWTITNSGDLPTSVPTVIKSGSYPAEFTATGCTTLLNPGASCVVSITYTPVTAGNHTALISVSATTGGSVSNTVTGTGLARITVVKQGSDGTVYAGTIFTCGTTCTGLFSLGLVTITAVTTNGSNSYFAGWQSDGGCNGPAATCALPTDLSRTMTATFNPMTYNLGFASSDNAVPHDLGPLTNYDARCNLLASDAGINNTAGNGYRAWLSNSTTRAVDRFDAGVRGFVRVDGQPLFDLLTDPLAPTNRIFHALTLDERGRDVGGAMVMTGTESGGGFPLAQNVCGDWSINTSAAGFGFGLTTGGPSFWTSTNFISCADPTRLYCLGNTKATALTPSLTAGKKIWLTNTPYVPSATTSPDQHCQAQRPGGVSTAKALISTTTTPAASALNGTQTYVRPDGQVVGTTAELLAAGSLRTGIWQTAAGAYLASDVWTGYNGPLSALPLAGTTCTNWTSTDTGGQLGRGGSPYFVSSGWWSSHDQNQCTFTDRRLICVEQ